MIVTMVVVVMVVVVAELVTYYYCDERQYLNSVNDDLDANQAKIVDKHGATIVEIAVELMVL